MRRSMVGRAVAALTLAVLVSAGTGVAAATAAMNVPATTIPQPAPASDVNRVLLISLPYVSFDDLRHVAMPNLTRLLDQSTIAGMAAHGGDATTSLIDGYATLGAGARSVGGGELDGAGFNVGESVDGTPAGVLFTQRTGKPAGRGVVQLGIKQLVGHNTSKSFGAVIGALGNSLALAGWHPAVLGNGDAVGDDTAVSSSLLMRDPAAPSGERLDPVAVDRQFTQLWTSHSVVLVEASDLVRAHASAEVETAAQQTKTMAATLQHTDALIGELLQHVDAAHDAVMVVGPTPGSSENEPTIASVRAPNWRPGLADSATTRRSGFVQLVDVAPTVLSLLGISRPTSMEGQPFKFSTTGGTALERRNYLADAQLEAVFRDTMFAPVFIVFIVLLGLALIGAIVLVTWRWRGLARWLTWLFAMFVLAYVPALLFARLALFHARGALVYWMFVVVVDLLIVAGVTLVGVRRRGDALIAVLGLVVVVIGLDVLLDSPLQFLSTIGYAPTGAGRFVGMGNLAYAAFSTAGLLLAVLAVDRWGKRALVPVLIGLAFLVAVDGAPFWGADVGGILSMVPAYGLTGWLLLGHRIRTRTIGWVAVWTVVVLAALTLLDLARPPSERTHLGRLAQSVYHDGWKGFWTVVNRKLDANLSTLGTSFLQIALIFVVLFIGWLWWYHRDRIDAVLDTRPSLRAGGVGFAILLVLGFAFNDSGISIPAIMLGIAGSAFVLLLLIDADTMPASEAAVPPAERVPSSAGPASGSGD
jgi:hypothetical protein